MIGQVNPWSGDLVISSAEAIRKAHKPAIMFEPEILSVSLSVSLLLLHFAHVREGHGGRERETERQVAHFVNPCDLINSALINQKGCVRNEMTGSQAPRALFCCSILKNDLDRVEE